MRWFFVRLWIIRVERNRLLEDRLHMNVGAVVYSQGGACCGLRTSSLLNRDSWRVTSALAHLSRNAEPVASISSVSGAMAQRVSNLHFAPTLTRLLVYCPQSRDLSDAANALFEDH